MSLKVNLHQDTARARHFFEGARCLKLQCSRLAERPCGIQLCLTAVPVILLWLSVLNQAPSKLICSIKRAGEGGGFQKEGASLFDLLSVYSFSLKKKKKIVCQFHRCSAVFLAQPLQPLQTPGPTLQTLLSRQPERHGATDPRWRAPPDEGRINVAMGRGR